MAIFRKFRERRIKRGNKKNGDWTLDDVRFLLIGKRSTHTDTVCHRVVADFVINAIEQNGNLRDSYNLSYEGGKYLIGGEHLISLCAHNRSLLIGAGNCGLASYAVR